MILVGISFNPLFIEAYQQGKEGTSAVILSFNPLFIEADELETNTKQQLKPFNPLFIEAFSYPSRGNTILYNFQSSFHWGFLSWIRSHFAFPRLSILFSLRPKTENWAKGERSSQLSILFSLRQMEEAKLDALRQEFFQSSFHWGLKTAVIKYQAQPTFQSSFHWGVILRLLDTIENEIFQSSFHWGINVNIAAQSGDVFQSSFHWGMPSEPH